MLMVALTAEKFGQSPYDYLTGSQLRLSVDYLCCTLILEAQTEAKNAHKTPHNPPTAVSDGM